MSNNVDLLSLLSDETSHQPTIDLLEAVSIPIILPSSPSHPLCDGKTLPCSLIWQSILRGHKTIHEVVNYLYCEYKTYKSDVQSSVIVSSFTGGVDGSMSEYDLMVLARYVLSVFNCVLLHKNVSYMHYCAFCQDFSIEGCKSIFYLFGVAFNNNEELQ
jgi:hypothetical protein